MLSFLPIGVSLSTQLLTAHLPLDVYHICPTVLVSRDHLYLSTYLALLLITYVLPDQIYSLR